MDFFLLLVVKMDLYDFVIFDDFDGCFYVFSSFVFGSDYIIEYILFCVFIYRVSFV